MIDYFDKRLDRVSGRSHLLFPQLQSLVATPFGGRDRSIPSLAAADAPPAGLPGRQAAIGPEDGVQGTATAATAFWPAPRAEDASLATDPAGPALQMRIGRIEIHRPADLPSPPAADAPRPPGMPLETYLDRKGRGG